MPIVDVGLFTFFLPGVLPSLRLWDLISVVAPFVFVRSNGPSSLIYVLCTVSSWSVACVSAGVSVAFHDVRTGERCEHAYAEKDGAECKGGGRFALGVVYCFALFFVAIVCLPRE